MQRPIRIGTRGSKLAVIQAEMVAARLRQAHGLDEDDVVFEIIQTTADKFQDRQLMEIGGKGLFTKEIEEALTDGRIDLAVHSMKDMPTVLPEGLIIDCVLEREDPRDAFISLKYGSLDALPQGVKFGTSSLRRAAQIRAKRPDLEIVPFRGNVQTRMRKLGDGVAEATLLAMAGLTRLDMLETATQPMEPEEMLPAIAQGIIGIERRVDDEALADLLQPLNHQETAIRMAAERAFLAELDGSCHTPIAGYATLAGGRIQFKGEIVKPDGSLSLTHDVEGPAVEAASLGRAAARAVKEKAGAELASFFAEE
ncbi:hydroxymethylbilane synthase [Tepidicaulis sp. LMO-SS28]|uniref:hydroxymethylbilane synthase n=1 Tax=Tepidicaulis sp. LMO-SS28 TaxID=3447455 RepID=UPI003EE048F1